MIPYHDRRRRRSRTRPVNRRARGVLRSGDAGGVGGRTRPARVPRWRCCFRGLRREMARRDAGPGRLDVRGRERFARVNGCRSASTALTSKIMIRLSSSQRGPPLIHRLNESPGSNRPQSLVIAPRFESVTSLTDTWVLVGDVCLVSAPINFQHELPEFHSRLRHRTCCHVAPYCEMLPCWTILLQIRSVVTRL